eukprot:TRINITY_DN5_c1_g1_i2.p1 TRINITY_DN5_c1_g1~~TRINITY_DN5_c1_g1_i2.p1  ORF type:complete len:852 (+),score=100.82 TRINITY_DN5_c1_g1_i2:1737-4292(+)
MLRSIVLSASRNRCSRDGRNPLPKIARTSTFPLFKQQRGFTTRSAPDNDASTVPLSRDLQNKAQRSIASTASSDPSKWTANTFLTWAAGLVDLDGEKILHTKDLAVLKKTRIKGSNLSTLTVEELERWGLPGGPAKSLFAAVQKLFAPSNTIDDFVHKIRQKREKLSSLIKEISPPTQCEFVDRPGFSASVERFLSRNLDSFEAPNTFQNKTSTANDYAYAVLAGGSGMGKTRAGFEIASRLEKRRPDYCTIHSFFLPSASALLQALPKDWDGIGRPRRQPGENGARPLALAIAASYFIGGASATIQSQLLQVDSRCSDISAVIAAIRRDKALPDETPLALVVQFDEFQEEWYNSLIMLRAVSDGIRDATFKAHNCLILPVLSGTAPNSISYIEEALKVTHYRSQVFDLAPLTHEESFLLAHRFAVILNPGFDLGSLYKDNPLFHHLLELVGGIPKVIEMLATVMTPSSRLKTAEDALVIFKSLMGPISNRYEISVILQALGGRRADHVEHGDACLRQLVSMAYFRDIVTRATPLNGSTIGDLEASGIIFLEPVPDEVSLAKRSMHPLFFVHLPRIFYFYFSQRLESWKNAFSDLLLRGGLQLTEDDFPGFVLHLHRATYTVCTWKRCYSTPESCQATLRDIYNNAAIALGDLSVLDQPIHVPPTIEYHEAPQLDEHGAAINVTDASSVRIRTSSSSAPFECIDLKDGRYLVLTRKRGSDVDAQTPHGREQYKWSNYLASGYAIPANANNKNTIFITAKLIEKEMNKGNVMQQKPFIIISPKQLLSPENGLISSQIDIQEPWFPDHLVLAVCGQNLIKFARGFLSKLSFPQAEPLKINGAVSEEVIPSPKS